MTGARLTTTVPSQYVHRAAVSEVFLTQWETDSPDRFSVTAQWPRGHALFIPVGGYQDPLLLVESVRQTGALLAHAEYGVPFGHQFLMWNMSFSADPEALAAGATPTEVVLRAECHDLVRRGATLAGMRYRVTVERDGMPLGVASAAFSCTSPAVYRRLRGDMPVRPSVPLPVGIAPETVGRAGSRDVVLAAGDPRTPRRWQLRVDTAHPIFFDHPVDHVPGMVLLEAARQAAHASTGMRDALPVGLDSTFERYAELDAPCWIEAEPGRPDRYGRTPTTVRGTQHGETVFTATVTLGPHRAR
ncbi:ScbA/BarX family gamma-butyrolactone biosynthesis protein [Streptomyces rubradiris]|uniref:ScbA/BarX family gamma-butyrolactone biosynthesis protein n=1 Tax=Streptomyces rubradiris TaxID=285531 RepID=UPI001E2E1B7A|nr:ScbA/BarX family gamma-butyrolactone biosynthesis protein [Streptomyces rubradiris]